uniref:60S ribosomal protein L29-like n=1 Tax=Jaculus jaculus TaxID=51337 RepID=UPI001E1B5B05|nr:60S ribosomal protein L29-like [Jaculus jaculus]
MHLAKKHREALKKLQANNTKAMNAQAEAVKAPVKPKQAKPKPPKGPSSADLLSSPTPSLSTYMTKSHRLCQTRTKAQTAAPAKAQIQALQLSLQFRNAPRPL